MVRMKTSKASDDKMISFRADPELEERLNRIKDREGRKMADVARKLVELGIRTLAGRRL